MLQLQKPSPSLPSLRLLVIENYLVRTGRLPAEFQGFFSRGFRGLQFALRGGAGGDETDELRACDTSYMEATSMDNSTPGRRGEDCSSRPGSGGYLLGKVLSGSTRHGIKPHF